MISPIIATILNDAISAKLENKIASPVNKFNRLPQRPLDFSSAIDATIISNAYNEIIIFTMTIKIISTVSSLFNLKIS